MKVFISAVVLVASLFLLSSCGRSTDTKQSITIGLDEDYKIKTFCDGSQWSGMSTVKSSVTGLDGITKYTFLAGEGAYALLSTQHYSIWIHGTVKPLDKRWDNCLWDLKVSAKFPFELVFSGFQSTGYKTNDDGMVFNCSTGETNLMFTNHLVLVYDKGTNSWIDDD